MNTYKPNYATHPGEHLAEILEAREIKKADFAKRAGISAKAVSQIINGKALYSSELALVFERVLEVDARIWMNLANNWQLFQAKLKEEKIFSNEATRSWLNRFPVSDLRKLGIVSSSRKSEDITESILRFLGVSNPEACSDWIASRAVAFRKSVAYTESDEATSIWLKLAENEAVKKEIPHYNRETFKAKLEDIRSLTLMNFSDAIMRLQELCNESGVYIVIIPKLTGIRLSGASWWLGNDRPVLALSLRYGTNDHFWFTFYHEVAHILLHGKKGIFLDSQDLSAAPDEEEADTFACNSLIDNKIWSSFVAKAKFHEASINSFSASIRIHPAIVVGRLQYEGFIQKNCLNGLKESIAIPDFHLSI